MVAAAVPRARPRRRGVRHRRSSCSTTRTTSRRSARSVRRVASRCCTTATSRSSTRSRSASTSPSSIRLRGCGPTSVALARVHARSRRRCTRGSPRCAREMPMDLMADKRGAGRTAASLVDIARVQDDLAHRARRERWAVPVRRVHDRRRDVRAGRRRGSRPMVSSSTRSSSAYVDARARAAGDEAVVRRCRR